MGGQPAQGTVCSGPARAMFQSRQTSAKGLLVKRTCRPSRPRAEEDFQGRFSLFCRVADGPWGLALRSRPVRGGETAGRPALQGQDLRQGWEEGCEVACEVGLEGVGSGRRGEGPGSLGGTCQEGRAGSRFTSKMFPSWDHTLSSLWRAAEVHVPS